MSLKNDMSVNEYINAIDDVLAFMMFNNLDYRFNKYAFEELIGFVKMVGFQLRPFWIRCIARGVRREIKSILSSLL